MKSVRQLITIFRTEYVSQGLNVKVIADNPLDQFEKWIEDAIKNKVNLPNAMHLATIGTGPHEAREDTILFPALRKILSKNEYFSLGEDFEDKEHELFGEDGFETMVEKVAGIEKQLGIFDLSKFTPFAE